MSLTLAIASTLALAEPLDINSANADQIALTMVGVGKVKANAIVQDRDKNGKFKTVDDLSRVKGIKSSLIDKNRDKVTVGQLDAHPADDLAKK
jgi:competence protein ComEA